MERLPDEIILNILTYLDLLDLVHFQQISRRFLGLGRDVSLWKQLCFGNSRTETQRRRQLLFNTEDARLTALRDAVSSLSPESTNASPAPGLANSASLVQASMNARARALANWDPSYPGEDIDFYQEYIHRHAPIAPIGWLPLPSQYRSEGRAMHEATGVGTLRDSSSGMIEKVVAPLDDGSICIWDIRSKESKISSRESRVVGRSAQGLLSGHDKATDQSKALSDSKAFMTEVGAIECVSIDNAAKRGLFAVKNQLHEVDLHTLQTISCETYPFAITALSETDSSTPVTVGTTSTVHLYDPRNKSSTTSLDPSVRTELIGGPTASHAVLSQPGPLSILHHNTSSIDKNSIWIAGRFTHILNYDRRSFPRLLSTIHSGARISSLTLLPYPHIPRSLDLLSNPSQSINALAAAKASPNPSILAAGVYKGKGSPELYSLPAGTSYINRQTAATSKLLSAVPHDGAIVYTDSDGNVKWIERNGVTPIRTFNINTTVPAPESGTETPSFNQASTSAQSSLFASVGQGDIVQKVLPTRGFSQVARSRLQDGERNNLLLWTGDGRIGMLGFGHEEPIVNERVEEQARTAEERAKEDAERQYSGTLRRMLEGQADEARFMRGLGREFGFLR